MPKGPWKFLVAAEGPYGRAAAREDGLVVHGRQEAASTAPEALGQQVVMRAEILELGQGTQRREAQHAGREQRDGGVGAGAREGVAHRDTEASDSEPSPEGALAGGDESSPTSAGSVPPANGTTMDVPPVPAAVRRASMRSKANLSARHSEG